MNFEEGSFCNIEKSSKLEQKIVRFGIQKVTVTFGEKNFDREMNKEARS